MSGLTHVLGILATFLGLCLGQDTGGLYGAVRSTSVGDSKDTPGYTLRDGGLIQSVNGSLHGLLEMHGPRTLMSNSSLGPDVSPLEVLVESVDSNVLRLKIGAPGRWEVPKEDLFINTGTGRKSGNPTYSVRYSTAPFGFAVDRVSANASAPPVFTTNSFPIIFKDQYIEISTIIPASATLYGLGEHTSTDGIALRRNGVPYALWTRDQPPTLPNVGVYGAQPFYMDVREDGQTHGVMLLNSNGMDVAITETKLQYRVTGGVLDFYFFMGPTPLKVIDQLTSVIGRPYMPPYWAFGLMQSKSGYLTLSYVAEVVENYTLAEIPLETVVIDNEAWSSQEIFTLSDGYLLPAFQNFVDRLHRNGQRWFPIVNTQMHIRQGYPPHDSGIQEDVFIKDVTGQPFVGQLWSGAVNYPDFFAKQTQRWWEEQIRGFNHKIPLDGIWVDMNEPDNFCTGDVCYDSGDVAAAVDFVCKLNCKRGLAEVQSVTNMPLPPAGIFEPPFAINVNLTQVPIGTKVISPTAHHLDGTLEYNVHNLYGHSSAMATWRALTNIYPERRPFVLTRSTFLGTGAYGAHWTGDTESSWDDLKWSIGDMLTNGVAGIAFVGGDICGFMKIATEELCARWAAAGAWQPFARNHHADGFQEFYLHPVIRRLTQKAYNWRLCTLPYHYTAFYDAHTNGCSVMRPLFFSWPSDSASLLIDRQWMLGDAIMVAPILLKGTITVPAYFPSGKWYDLYNHSSIDTSATPLKIPVTASLDDNPPVYILGGNIVPFGSSGLMTTNYLRASNLTLIAAFPSAQSPPFERCGQGCAEQSSASRLVACGHMYLDQGEQPQVGSARDNYLAFAARQDTAAGSGALVLYWPNAPGGSAGCSSNTSWPILDAVTILGIPPVDTASVSVLGAGTSQDANTAFSTASSPLDSQYGGPVQQTAAPVSVYAAPTHELSITGLGIQLQCPNSIKIAWASKPASPPPSRPSPSPVPLPISSPSLIIPGPVVVSSPVIVPLTGPAEGSPSAVTVSPRVTSTSPVTASPALITASPVTVSPAAVSTSPVIVTPLAAGATAPPPTENPAESPSLPTPATAGPAVAVPSSTPASTQPVPSAAQIPASPPPMPPSPSPSPPPPHAPPPSPLPSPSPGPSSAAQPAGAAASLGAAPAIVPIWPSGTSPAAEALHVQPAASPPVSPPVSPVHSSPMQPVTTQPTIVATPLPQSTPSGPVTSMSSGG